MKFDNVLLNAYLINNNNNKCAAMPLFLLLCMYMYSWLITFEIFSLDRGVGGWDVSYANILGFLYIFFIFTRAQSSLL